MAWDYPFFIVATFVAAIVIALVIMRVAGQKREVAAFECGVCGRSQRGATPKEWRYCPYCGAPRDAKSLKDMPSRRRSVLDL